MVRRLLGDIHAVVGLTRKMWPLNLDTKQAPNNPSSHS